MKSYFVYIMASFKRVLYIGVTSALQHRVWQHQHEVFDSGFTKRYRAHRLVYFEQYSHIVTAITREKRLKRWTRAKKIALISTSNPKWKDLSLAWGKEFALRPQSPGVTRDTTAAKLSDPSFAEKKTRLVQDDNVDGGDSSDRED